MVGQGSRAIFSDDVMRGAAASWWPAAYGIKAGGRSLLSAIVSLSFRTERLCVELHEILHVINPGQHAVARIFVPGGSPFPSVLSPLSLSFLSLPSFPSSASLIRRKAAP